jgi:hypothetical protein
MTGCMNCGMPDVVCSAIAVQTVSMPRSAMPWLRRKSQATFQGRFAGAHRVIGGISHTLTDHEKRIKELNQE